MTTLSLREAAEQTGVSKSTIFRAIKAGRMSAPRNDAGEFEIQPAELFRVYPPKAQEVETVPVARDVPAQPETSAVGRDAPASETVELRIRNASLEAEIKGLRAMTEELREARDRWERQAERLTLALAAPKPAEAPQPVAPAENASPRRGGGWWPFRRAS